MTNIAKATKDKIYGATPRLMPRQTAASAARAARNATNRNLTVPISQRVSPNRANSSVAPIKVTKSVPQRNSLKTDSKTDFKITLNPEYELLSPENMPMSDPTAETNDSFANEDISTLLLQNTEEPIDSAIEENAQEINNSIKFELRGSRPQTPTINSRPLTPKSLQSSRPQTPRIHSRPTTPAPPTSRCSAPTSRPNTPQRLSTPSRPKTPSNLPVPTNKIRQDNPGSPYLQRSTLKEDEDLKSVFLTKKRQFQRMKKELDLKQQAILEIFDCLQNMRERMSKEGVSGCGEGVQQQELVVFNVADWATDEVTQLCRDAVASSNSDNAMELISTSVVIDESFISELDAKIVNIPACFADLCLQAFTSRQEIIDWAKEHLMDYEGNRSEVIESIARYNADGLQLCETLRELKTRADITVNTITQISKRVYGERSALLTVGESLVREIARLRQDIEAHNTIANEMRELRVDCEATRVLEDTRRELDEERVARSGTKEKLATTESQLRQTRARVSKMDKQLREAEASIASLTGTVKMLEDQSRQREVQLEARARKLKESLKTGEVTSGQLAQQRDALQAEVNDLREQIDTLTSHNKSTIQDLNYQLRDIKNALEEQCQLTEQETQSKKATELALVQSRNAIEDMRAKIIELENSRPNPDLPTEREMDLWAELQATKDTLRTTEEEVTACKREKVRFLETLTKISEPDNKVGLQQKLAAELLSKEEIIGKMQTQIRELTKNIKLNEQKVIQYEQYVRNLQAHNRAVANCQEAPNGISYQDLQQEIMNLKMNLLDAVHRNEELSELLMQKEQQLEHQDKTSRAQARVIKVREELINMLKNKETEQSRELSALQQDLEHRMKVVDEVNKQIAAKADEIQELFATLENKQQQIHRLEKIVLALEEQQRRSQAQRTRHEEKIAALEHELAAGGNRRERKFIFF